HSLIRYRRENRIDRKCLSLGNGPTWIKTVFFLRGLICSPCKYVAQGLGLYCNVSNLRSFPMAQATMAAIPGLKDTYSQLRARMEKAVEDFRKEMATTRTGRANVHMLDGVNVDYYGTQTPLNHIANVHAEAQLITIQAWD